MMSEAPLNVEHALCPVCRSDDYSLAFRRPDLRFCCSPHVFTIVRCRTCGMGYILDRPTEAALRTFYPPTFYATNHDNSGQEAPLRHNSVETFENDPALQAELRESYHRHLYTAINSNRMNGITEESSVAHEYNAWQWALTGTWGVCIGLTAVSAVLWALSTRRSTKKRTEA